VNCHTRLPLSRRPAFDLAHREDYTGATPESLEFLIMREMLVVTTSDGAEVRYLLEVDKQGEHWSSQLGKLGPTGDLESARVAPRFYGMTEEQARRRMIDVLENQYEEVRSLGGV
jgi:hypothetical protein